MSKEYICLSALVAAGTLFFYKFTDLKKDAVHWGTLLWLVLTAACLFKNMLAVGVLVFFISRMYRKRSNLERVMLYLLLLCIIPSDVATKFLGLNFGYSWGISFIILLPIFFHYQRYPDKRLFSMRFDKYVLLYFLFIMIMDLREHTLLGILKVGTRHLFERALAYFVLTRVIEKEDDFTELFKPILFTGSILAIVALLERLKSWDLYGQIRMSLLSDPSAYTSAYIFRGGLFRATASFAHPIVLGVHLVIILAFLIYSRESIFKKKNFAFYSIFLIVLAGLLSTISRGPLIGLILFLAFYFLLSGAKALKRMGFLFLLILFLLGTPIGKSMVSNLPFIQYADKAVNDEAQAAAETRAAIVRYSAEAVKHNPLFGNINFNDDPAIQELGETTGAGVPWYRTPNGNRYVDITNAYCVIALEYGLIGLGLFLLFMAKITFGAIRTYIVSSQAKELGRVLLSITFALLVMLGNGTFYSYITTYTFILFAFNSSYAYLGIARARARKTYA